MSENVQNNPEMPPKANKEIDLGEVLSIIGNIFNKIFLFIRNMLLIFFDLLIRILIIIRVHFIKFAIVGVLSIIVGFFVDSRQPTLYSSSMVINANYGSARQLYSNIRYYNNLTVERDSMKLASIFGIKPQEASKITGFSIEPNVTQNDILKDYDEYMKAADTLIIKDYIDFNKFKYSIDPVEYERQKITIASVEQDVFGKLQEALITNNIENKFITKSKKVRISNLEREQKALRKRLDVIDTLRNVYNKSILSEATKTSSAQTNIQMSASTVKTNEIELLDMDDKISKEILRLEKEKEFSGEVIEVLNGFSPGSKVRDFFNSFLFRIPVITLTLLLLFILLRELNRYLNTYEEKKRLNA